jgi:uncharacterized glyoxalase superfamily protein PhnB
MPRVVHFEIPADNTGRAVQFYKTVFGWDIQKKQMPMEYYLATTGKEGTMGINGAIMEKKGATAKTIVNAVDRVAQADCLIGESTIYIYCRVSDPRQTQGTSLQEQQQNGIAYAESKGQEYRPFVEAHSSTAQ